MLLEVSNLSKNFGGLEVLRDVSFQMEGGEILGLIGPNGAGKTTILNAITGVVAASGGLVHFMGESILGLRPDEICRRGLARTFQMLSVFPTMTAGENVLVGSMFGGRCRGTDARNEAMKCLDLFHLAAIKDVISVNLSYAERKLVEIARAVASRPKLILLDEPLSGLDLKEADQVMKAVSLLRRTCGTSVIWIEHKTEAIFKSCDRILVLDYGRKIAEGTPGEMSMNKKVLEAYVGESLT